jgi:hypothetical protein
MSAREPGVTAADDGNDPSTADDEADAGAVEHEADVSEHPKPKSHKRNGPTTAQTMGGVIFGFEQQVWRTAPPPQELVHHARPDASVPAGDGSFLTIAMPVDLRLPDDDPSPEHDPSPYGAAKEPR